MPEALVRSHTALAGAYVSTSTAKVYADWVTESELADVFYNVVDELHQYPVPLVTLPLEVSDGVLRHVV
jgi:hypothetical protein